MKKFIPKKKEGKKMNEYPLALNCNTQKLVDEIRKAVGDENVGPTIKLISHSSQPQYYTLSLFSNGFPNLLTHTMKFLSKCNVIFPTNYMLPVRSALTTAPKSGCRLPELKDKYSEIKKLLQTRGNSINPLDIIKIIKNDPHFIGRDLANRFIIENDINFNNYPFDVFDEISDPETKGDLIESFVWSYTKNEYKFGYPKSSGIKSHEQILHNNDWVACEQDTEDDTKAKVANQPQVTEEMENIENFNNELDVKIIRNKNVYRMLKNGGPFCASFSYMVAEELNEIYPGRGAYFVQMLKIVPNQLYPIIMSRLRERGKELYIRKISEPIKWCKKLESILPAQRTIFRKDTLKKVKSTDITSIRGDKLDFPADDVHFLNRFFEIARSNMPDDQRTPDLFERLQNCFKKICGELKDTENRVLKLSYYHAACIYCAAYFLHEVCSAKVIDDVKSSSVQTAVSIALSDVNDHGHQRIFNLIADTINRKKVGKKSIMNPTNTSILEISGLLFDIDFELAANLVTVGALFFRVLKEFALEPLDEAQFIKCEIGSNSIALMSADSNEAIKLTL